MSDLMEEHIDSGSRCRWGHPLMLAAEGYAYCRELDTRWWPWRLTPPGAAGWPWWAAGEIVGRDGKPIHAWCGARQFSLKGVLEFIQEDIDAHRGLPFDEDRERARLMPV